MTAPAAPPNLGFLTILQEGNATLGGYLVTNLWGRPLEFRLSTAVSPNRVQQILYAGTLAEYLASDLIGKTLLDKTGTPAGLILTDSADALGLRRLIDMPVAWVAPVGDPRIAEWSGPELLVQKIADGRAVLLRPDAAGDLPLVKSLFDRAGAGLDVAEPFGRIREAIAEARRMGVTQRGAA